MTPPPGIENIVRCIEEERKQVLVFPERKYENNGIKLLGTGARVEGYGLVNFFCAEETKNCLSCRQFKRVRIQHMCGGAQ